MERAIYLITGVMAAGKSTVAQILAGKIEKCVHVRGDVFRRMIISGRAEMTAQPSEEGVRQLHLRYLLSTNAAKSYYENGFSVVLQDNYYGVALQEVLSLLNDYPVHVIVLCPDVETIKERERTRNKTGYVGFEVEELYDAFMKETPRIGLWLDTSHQTPEQSAESILLYFGI